MALPVFVSSSEDLAGGPGVGTDLEITLPPGYAAGDVVGILVMSQDVSDTVSPGASGFVLVASTTYGSPNGYYRLYRKAMTGTEGASVHFTITADSSCPWVAVAYSGVAPATFRTATNSSGNSVMEIWSTPSYSAVVQEVAVGFIKAFTGYDLDASSTLRSGSISADIVAVSRTVGPGLTAGSTIEMTGDVTCAIALGMRPLNSAPYAPTLNSPTGGTVVDVGSTNRFSWTFNDPDFDLPRAEGQLKYEIRYRSTAGAPPWTTLTPSPTTNQYHDFAASTFTTAVNYEWQVRTYDLAGEVGPWSPSAFFTGGTAPPAPVITDPTLDEEIVANSFEVDWTVTTQTAYRIRTVADDNGAPNPNVVYYDSAPQPFSVPRSATIPFLTNNRTEHVQVQVFNGTLWSAWASVRVRVAYTPPPAPTILSLSPNVVKGGLWVTYDTPAPVGDQPAPAYVEIWVDDGDDIPDEPKVTGLALTGQWLYRTPRGGRDYRPHIHAIAVTADGIPSPAVGQLTFLLDDPTRGVLDQNYLA